MHYNSAMFPRNPYKVPEGTSTEEALEEWRRNELDKWDGDIPAHLEVQLLEVIYRFYKDPKNDFFKTETIESYKKQYVNALMDNGWIMKQGSLELRADASRFFKLALHLIPQNPLAYYRLGHLSRSKSLGDSIGYFAKAMELSTYGMEVLDFLQLNSSQIANARGMSIALLSELNESFYDPFEFIFEPRQVEFLKQFINSTSESQVVHFIHGGEPSGARTISLDNYDELLNVLREDPNALVIDHFNARPYIRYLGNEIFFENGDRKLKYLLQSFRLKPAEELLIRSNTYSQNARRLNNDLRNIGVSEEKLHITSTSNPSGISAISSLTVHYFKNLLR